MLQRTPTWMFSRPAKDALANFLRRWLPHELAYRITRWKNIRLQDLGFKRAREPFATEVVRTILADTVG